ncbi:hypothetical protein CPLU01_16017 [Colletotrichum plurivorum]|uniref:Uncharacterized protein n=1 Tax=Colletotrichum plurivorum TaxID=2175906 RepID=A0A8H6MQA0_9PEZI|nr:hypothetical protein CPLU01_16017 [Colletotrichum plurivorum]
MHHHCTTTHWITHWREWIPWRIRSLANTTHHSTVFFPRPEQQDYSKVSNLASAMGGRDRPRLASRLNPVPGCPRSPRRTCYTAHENRVPPATAAEDDLAARGSEPPRPAAGSMSMTYLIPPSFGPPLAASFRPPPTGNSRYTASPGKVVSHKTRRR